MSLMRDALIALIDERRSEPLPYCKPDQHMWVALVGGRGYNADFDSMVCILCRCYSSVRRDQPKHTARPPHPNTMAGRK